jgi:HSP20 family protein
MKLMRINPNQVNLWDLSPVEQWNTLQQEINRLFESPSFAGPRGDLFSGWSPALDLTEDKENVYVRLELPGFQRSDLDISLHEGVLNVSGERKAEPREDTVETYRAERFFGRFHRSVSLPKPVKTDKVKAQYRDGILTVTLPKTEEVRPKQIEVQVH